MQMIFFFFGLFVSTPVFAVCPLCTFAIGAGIGLTQYLGIDDTISGIWIGGLIVSLIAWTISLCNKKNIRFYGRKILITLAYYGLTLVPLYTCGCVGHSLNRLWEMDKILLGVTIGSGALFTGFVSYNQLKKRNNNKAYFPFQKVVMPILPLVILSVIFYFLTK